MQQDARKRKDGCMKKTLILLLVVVLLTACSNSGATETQDEEKNEPVFTDEDIALAKEIIEFVHEKETEFVEEANKELDKTRNSYEKYETMTEGFTANKEIREDFKPLSKKIVLDSLLEQYGDNVIKREDKENMEFRVNVRNYDADGESISLSDFQITTSYENLELEEPTIEYHDQYGVHELIFPVNEENTTIFMPDATQNSSLNDRFTFYKTRDGDLIVGVFESILYNAKVSDFEDDPEDVQEDLQELPPLQ